MPRQKPLFGRSSELDVLLKNIDRPGLTVVEALPGQGTTRLLEELCDVVGKGKDSRIKNTKYLIGYREAAAADRDLLRKALQDLYVRWLSNASYVEQAKEIWESNKRDLLIDTFGSLAATIGGGIASFSGHPAGAAIGKTVEGWFNLLVGENRKLETGGIQGLDPPISYEQARDLLGLLSRISKVPVKMVLVLDAFEQCSTIEEQADNLNRFLKHIDEWPPCHFLIAVRRPPAKNEEGELEGLRQANKLKNAHSHLVHRVLLGPMDLSDSDEKERVWSVVREAIEEPR